MTSPDRTPSDERAIARAVQAWFARAARPLPWRTPGRRDPWASLVSEVMAQQTQISRVVERYPPFIARFPTPAALAAADESEVMRLWRGMGYYRRARLLHEAARAIVGWHGGSVPDRPRPCALPGSAGTPPAVASIALGSRNRSSMGTSLACCCASTHAEARPTNQKRTLVLERAAGSSTPRTTPRPSTRGSWRSGRPSACRARPYAPSARSHASAPPGGSIASTPSPPRSAAPRSPRSTPACSSRAIAGEGCLSSPARHGGSCGPGCGSSRRSNRPRRRRFTRSGSGLAGPSAAPSLASHTRPRTGSSSSTSGPRPATIGGRRPCPRSTARRAALDAPGATADLRCRAPRRILESMPATPPGDAIRSSDQVAVAR